MVISVKQSINKFLPDSIFGQNNQKHPSHLIVFIFTPFFGERAAEEKWSDEKLSSDLRIVKLSFTSNVSWFSIDKKTQKREYRNFFSWRNMKLRQITYITSDLSQKTLRTIKQKITSTDCKKYLLQIRPHLETGMQDNEADKTISFDVPAIKYSLI